MIEPVDELAVRRTLYRFARAIDTRDWAAYRAVFTDEIDLDYSSYRPGSVGRMRADEWVGRGVALFEGLDATQHSLTNPLVDVDGDSAAITVYLVAEHVLGDHWFTIGGYYQDRLVRAGDGWLITGKKLVVTWTRGDRGILELAARGNK